MTKQLAIVCWGCRLGAGLSETTSVENHSNGSQHPSSLAEEHSNSHSSFMVMTTF